MFIIMLTFLQKLHIFIYGLDSNIRIFCLFRKDVESMSITLKEKEKEEAFLKEIIKEIKSQLDSLGKEIHIKNEQINEFKKFYGKRRQV